MSLVSAQWGQTIHYLSWEDTVVSETSVIFVSSKPLKQSKPGSKPTVEFVPHPDNHNICVVTTLKACLDCTSALCGGAQQLFVSYSKPLKPVSRDTISTWVKTVMEKSGIVVNLFKPHSTRAAATFKAFWNLSHYSISYQLHDEAHLTHLPRFIKSLLSTQIAFLPFCYKVKDTKLLWLWNMFFGVCYFVHVCSVLLSLTWALSVVME